MRLPEKLPIATLFIFTAGGLLLNSFSSQLPDDFETIGAYTGLLCFVLGMAFLIHHILKIQPSNKERSTVWLCLFLFFCFASIFSAYKAYKYYHGPSEGVTTPNALDDSLVFECIQSKLPTKMPPEGKLGHLSLHYHPDNGMRGIGVSVITREPGSDLMWRADDNQGYRCVVRNYSDKPAFNVEMKLEVSFRELVKTGEGAATTGDEVHRQDYLVNIPVLNANGEEEFVFFVENQSMYWVTFYPKPIVAIGRINDKLNQEVKINVSNGLPIKTNFTLPPFNLDERLKAITSEQ